MNIFKKFITIACSLQGILMLLLAIGMSIFLSSQNIVTPILAIALGFILYIAEVIGFMTTYKGKYQ